MLVAIDDWRYRVGYAIWKLNAMYMLYRKWLLQTVAFVSLCDLP